MYVIVRTDLSMPQVAVQSCHACIEATKAFEVEKLQEHPSVIILAAKSEAKLQQIRQFLIANGIRHVHFYEADLNDQLTAIATEPIHGEKRDLFRKFQLIKDKKNPESEEETTRYVAKYPDGYYWWAGDCGSSPHRTWSLHRAAKYDTKEDALWGNRDAQAIPVTISYRFGKGGQS